MRSNKPVLVVIGVLLLISQIPAQFNRTALLIDSPTADVLPYGSLAAALGVTFPLPNMGMNVGWERGGNLRFSPLKRLELALTAYTYKDYVLGAQYQLISGEREESDRKGFSLALGVHDIGLYSYVSPIGHDTGDAWPDWKYQDRPQEKFSAFVVGTIPIGGFARAHLGLGRGRYVGYARGRFINTDIFFGEDERHQWAIGLFGGAELNLGKHLALCGEINGRDVSAGLKGFFGPITAGIAWHKIEGITPKDPESRFGRIALALSYQTGNLLQPRVPELPPPPPPVPEEEIAEEEMPEEKLPEEKLLRELRPIYFDFDKSDIRPGDAEILKGNAKQILDAVKAGQKFTVTIEGHCCPMGTAEYNMGLGMRRAESAKGYLLKLGVDGGLLNTISYGEERLVTTDSLQYHLNRRCEFKVIAK